MGSNTITEKLYILASTAFQWISCHDQKYKISKWNVESLRNLGKAWLTVCALEIQFFLLIFLPCTCWLGSWLPDRLDYRVPDRVRRASARLPLDSLQALDLLWRRGLRWRELQAGRQVSWHYSRSKCAQATANSKRFRKWLCSNKWPVFLSSGATCALADAMLPLPCHSSAT